MEDVAFVDAVPQLKFDFAVVGAYPASPCNAILRHRLEIPFIFQSTGFLPWHILLPALTSSTGFLLALWKSNDRMSFFERKANAYGYSSVHRAAFIPSPSNSSIIGCIVYRKCRSAGQTVKEKWSQNLIDMIRYTRGNVHGSSSHSVGGGLLLKLQTSEWASFEHK